MSDDKNPSPFQKLAALRDALPAGPAPVPKPAKPLFLEKVVVRHQRKGHGGKTVTMISGIAPHALEILSGEMKRALGCGARVEEGSVVLQGDLVVRAMAFLDAAMKKAGSSAKLVKGS